MSKMASRPRPFLTGLQLIGAAAVFVALVVVAMELSPDYPTIATLASLLVVALSVVVCGGGIFHTLRTGYIAGRFPWGYVEFHKAESPRLFWLHFGLGLAVILPVAGLIVLIIGHKLVDLFG